MVGSVLSDQIASRLSGRMVFPNHTKKARKNGWFLRESIE